MDAEAEVEIDAGAEGDITSICGKKVSQAEPVVLRGSGNRRILRPPSNEHISHVAQQSVQIGGAVVGEKPDGLPSQDPGAFCVPKAKG